MTDYVAVINNDDGVPLHLADGKDWTDFQERWGKCAQTEQSCEAFRTASAAEQTEMNWRSARELWGRAYRSMCPRCSLDGYSCGFCEHGRHICACPQCCAPCKQLTAAALKQRLSGKQGEPQ